MSDEETEESEETGFPADRQSPDVPGVGEADGDAVGLRFACGDRPWPLVRVGLGDGDADAVADGFAVGDEVTIVPAVPVEGDVALADALPTAFDTVVARPALRCR